MVVLCWRMIWSLFESWPILFILWRTKKAYLSFCVQFFEILFQLKQRQCDPIWWLTLAQFADIINIMVSIMGWNGECHYFNFWVLRLSMKQFLGLFCWVNWECCIFKMWTDRLIRASYSYLKIHRLTFEHVDDEGTDQPTSCYIVFFVQVACAYSKGYMYNGNKFISALVSWCLHFINLQKSYFWRLFRRLHRWTRNKLLIFIRNTCTFLYFEGE